MDVQILMRGAMIFLVVLVTFSTNISDNIIVRLGLESSIGFVVFAALLVTFFIVGRHGLIIGVIILFCLNANMPVDFDLNMGFDRDYYTGLMIALLVQPLTVRLFA